MLSVLAVLITPTFHGSHVHGGQRTKCASNLRQIGQGIMLYANDHRGTWPDSLDELILSADLNPECFVCPSSRDSAAPGATAREQAANLYKPGHISFIYLGKGLKEPVHPNRVVAYEAMGNHDASGINVLFGDGHVEWFSEPQAKKILAELAAGWNPPRSSSPGSAK
jgi:prepilin-type processing-associated H-X9-DG protein